MLPETPDFVSLIKRAAVDPAQRYAAALSFGRIMAFPESPLISDHGNHALRMSNFGACSAAFVAQNLGLEDLPASDDTQLAMFDAGTLQGAWLACLLVAGFQAEYGLAALPVLEYEVVYRDAPGHIDVLIFLDLFGGKHVVEVKTTPSSGELKPPDTKKLYQCLQAGGYACGVEAERFTVITFGANVGNNKFGVPHPKLRQDTYLTADYKPLVDAEIDRLTELLTVDRAFLEENIKMLADADAFRCKGCKYGACFRNENPTRYAL